MSIRRVARAAVDLVPPPDDPAVADLLLAAHAQRAVYGYVPAVPCMRRGLHAMLAEGAESGDAARWLLLGIMLAVELWDVEAFGDCARRYSAAARRYGALRMLQAGAAMANYELLCGHNGAAQAFYAEFKDLAAAIGADMTRANAGDVLLHAWHGDRDRTVTAAAVHIGPSAEQASDIPVQLSRASLVILELGNRRFPAALAAAQAVYDQDPPLLGSRVLPDHVEAAVRDGDIPAAQLALARLTERATASGTPWALGVLARSRALLADDACAEELYVHATALLEQTPVVTEIARTHLLYGEWLRRRRRRLDARKQLRHAYEMFGREDVDSASGPASPLPALPPWF